MKTMKTLLSLAVVAVLSISQLSAQSFQANTATSTVKWVGTGVGKQHSGSVKLKDGQLSSDKGAITGTFTIDLTTIADEDLPSKDYQEKLNGHLKSEDFFDVAKFPTAVFKITKAVEKKDKDNNYEITGDLTLKGVTQSITFPANLVVKSSGFIAKATLKIDRTKWGIKYGSKTFFGDLKDKAIGDDISLDLYATSVK